MTVQTNDQPIVGAYGDVYTAPAGTPIPTDVTAPGAAWTKLGLISEDGATWTPPEEETTDIKVWQSPYPARTVTTGLTSSMAFAMDEWDRESIPFALGGGTFDDTGADVVVFHPPAPGESQMKALFVKVLDGDVKLGVYFQKGKVTGRDDTTFKPDEAALLNVEFSLQAEAGKDPYNLVFSKDCFPGVGGTTPATGATAGIPGSWTPSGSDPPYSLVDLQSSGVVASPNTAWTSGQYVVLGDASQASWDGTAWEAGAQP
jgi:hypothetical protein